MLIPCVIMGFMILLTLALMVAEEMGNPDWSDHSKPKPKKPALTKCDYCGTSSSPQGKCPGCGAPRE